MCEICVRVCLERYQLAGGRLVASDRCFLFGSNTAPPAEKRGAFVAVGGDAGDSGSAGAGARARAGARDVAGSERWVAPLVEALDGNAQSALLALEVEVDAGGAPDGTSAEAWKSALELVAVGPVVGEPVAHERIDGGQCLHVVLAPLASEILALQLEKLQHVELVQGVAHTKSALQDRRRFEHDEHLHSKKSTVYK